MANFYWDQSFMASIKGYRDYYIYFLYFMLIFFNVSAVRTERIIVLLFLASLVIFAIDYVTFPDPMFAWRSEERRSGISIFFYGQGFTFLGAFYFLNKFFNHRNLVHLAFFGVSFVCLFVLTQSRMNLLALGSGFFLLLLASNFPKKYIITVFILIAAGIFYTTATIFQGIKDDSKDQAQFYKEDIRVLAHNYFITDFQGGTPTMLLGNGFPAVGSDLAAESARGNAMGFWTSDVGLTGIFSYFGLLGVVIWLLFFYKVFTKRHIQNAMYLKAYFLTLLTTSFAAYSIFEPGYMPATVLALYLLRCQSTELNEADEAAYEEEAFEEEQGQLSATR